MRRFLLLSACAALLSACGDEAEPLRYRANPDLPEPRRGLLPDMKIVLPEDWGNDLPTVPDGFTIQPIATDLSVPRQTLVLPNGDILIAEGSGGGAPSLRPKDLIANYIKVWERPIGRAVTASRCCVMPTVTAPMRREESSPTT